MASINIFGCFLTFLLIEFYISPALRDLPVNDWERPISCSFLSRLS